VFAFNRTGFYPVTSAAIALELSLLRHSVTHFVERTDDQHSATNTRNSRTTKTHSFLTQLKPATTVVEVNVMGHSLLPVGSKQEET
jgi:hypothetical protein